MEPTLEDFKVNNKSASELLIDFVNMNNILIIPIPKWIPRDDGTFSLVISLDIKFKDKK